MEARRPGRSGRSSTGHHLASDPRCDRARTRVLASRRQHGSGVRHCHDRACRRRSALSRRVRRAPPRVGHDAARGVRAGAPGVRAIARPGGVAGLPRLPRTVTDAASRPNGVVRETWRQARWKERGVELLIVVVLGLLGIAAATAIGPRLGVAAPLLLVIIGIAVSFLPFVPAVEIDPEWILAGVLPPLLYSASV